MRRLAYLLSVWLLLGLCTSIAIAWVSLSLIRPALGDNFLVQWTHISTHAHNGWWISEFQDPLVAVRRISPNTRSWSNRGAEEITPPSFSHAFGPPPADESFYVEKEAGWPLRCMRLWWHESDENQTMPHETIRAGFSAQPIEWGLSPYMGLGQPDFDYVAIEERSGLPLAPIWANLALNTALFAAAWCIVLLPFFLPGMFIRLRRRRKARCVKCGYEIGVETLSACPECGNDRNNRPRIITTFPILANTVVVLLVISALIGFGIHRSHAFGHLPSIHVAAANGDLDRLRAELDRGTDPNLQLTYDHELYGYKMSHTTPLMWAALRGHTDLCRVLVDAGATLEIGSGRDLKTVLSVALEGGHPETISYLHEIMPEAPGTPDMLTSSMRANPKELSDLLTRYEWSPGMLDDGLSTAASNNKPAHAKLLIEAGARPTETHAWLAVRNDAVEIVRMLSDYGLDYSTTQKSLVWQACDNSNANMVRTLIELGCDVNEGLGDQPMFEGWIPIRRSVIKCDIEMLNALADAGADPTAVDPDGDSLLHMAILLNCGDPAMLARLVELGVDVNLRSNSGRTALMLAAAKGNLAAVQSLLQLGADATLVDFDGNSALSFATGGAEYSPGRESEHSPEIVQLLSD